MLRRAPRDVKGLALGSLVAMLLLDAGCAKRQDWIQATLVTADVSGTWHGVAGSSFPYTVTLLLEQQGPRVKGRLTSSRGYGSIEGTVEGDVFRFSGTL